MRNALKNLTRNEQGQALITVLVFLLVGGLIIAPHLGFMSTGLKAADVHELKMLELYTADSGVEDALWKMGNTTLSFPYGPYSLTEDINGKAVTVTIEQVGTAYKITSTAATNSSSNTTIESYVVRPFSMFDFAAAALNGDLSV